MQCFPSFIQFDIKFRKTNADCMRTFDLLHLLKSHNKTIKTAACIQILESHGI